MAADSRIIATICLIFAATTVYGQTSRCYYMTDAIPREPKPDDFTEIEWSGGWQDFPLIPAEPRDDVCIASYYPPAAGGSTGTLIVHMEEEIVGDVAIAKLNYDGPQTPTIVQPLTLGSFAMLGPQIRNVSGEWLLIITQRQDYETASMRLYSFDIRIDGETRVARVTLSIENIDDNFPIIRPFEACEVPELGEPRLTDCVYQVYDADGRLSIEPMTFEISSDRGDEDTFYIHPTWLENDWENINFTIGLKQALNFETLPLHLFRVSAIDSWPNIATATVVVEVQNVEHRPPRWVEIFAVQQFDEKTTQQFTVRAIDGDTGIDKPIYYTLRREDEDDFFTIETLPGGRDGAIFHVAPIDRDALERELFNLTLIAYKYDNESFATEAPIVIIINDVNDQRPEPLFKEYFVSFEEETPLTLNFDEEFGFHDRDLGVHAQYNVTIESEYPPGAETAFYIAPQLGYQRQTFIMGTLDHRRLDFEDPPFQNISLKVIATDTNKPEFVGVAHVYISLINWNDEEPIFNDTTPQSVRIEETVEEGFLVATVRATDRDIGDRVEHTLMGNAASFLRIDNYTGEIFVTIKDAFDYHRQNELNVQIRADDTFMEPYNTATTQLVIQLIDINNTPPTLRLPRTSPSVDENRPEGYIISEEVTATDPDTTAYLQFEIDWETSYGTKQGRNTDPIHIVGCAIIETIFPDPENHGSAIGRIVVQEIRHNVTIDFEEFEILYLSIRVRDLNTTLGDDTDESTFAIIIIDLNDNWPIFADGSLEQNFRVRERSNSDLTIGSVLATDIDGPLYNQVRYTILPRNNTLEGLVKIDFYTGQLSVDEDAAIDADIPPRWNLYYTVVASDKCVPEDREEGCPPDKTYWNTEGEITIEIIDLNNKEPMPDTEKFDVEVSIFEKAPDGMLITQLFSIDQDRDEIYKTVRYQIQYSVAPALRDFFAVNLDTGELYVSYQSNLLLDRDRGAPNHTVFFTIIDNFFSEGDGNRNQNNLEVLVILLDINDNAPELPTPEQLPWSVSEDLKQGVRVPEYIYAPDADEPNTPNTHVGYAILDLTTERDIEVPRLFNMLSENNRTGELETAMDLRGYWGSYKIHIMAFDHGTPQQISYEIYDLEIRPFNYHQPVFVFPESETVVRLRRETLAVLSKVNGDPLERLHATDEDGLHAGEVDITVAGDDEAVNFFTVTNDNNNGGSLSLINFFSENIREFEVILRATDRGTEPGPLYSESKLTLIFVPTQGDPVFNVSSYTVGFFEQEVGLTERFALPLAEDPKNYRCTDDCYDIYYRILDGNAAGHFALDPVENVIYLVTELDRNQSTSYTLTIAASNSLDPGPPLLAAATLSLTVNVREAAPRPVFQQDLYTAGISTADNVNRELLVVHATHSEGVPVTYTIDEESMEVDATLEAVRDSAFVLNPDTGVLVLNIQPTAAMHGMFEFNVVATDTADKTDTAEVKVYLISSQNRVFFIFNNTVEQVESHRNFIAETFSREFNMICNIDQVIPATDSSGVAQASVTEVRSHFILNNVPVNADVIEELRNDGQLLSRIQVAFRDQQLNLQDFVTGVSPDIGNNRLQITIYVLAGIAAFFGFLCLILLIIMFIRTRTLNRRLEALSMTKYGSVDSGLNRVGLAAPGTNKHAVEGSNPIWNEMIKAPDFDAISDASGESDLIGIEDMPQFRTDYFPEDADSTNGIVIDRMPAGKIVPIATHGNDFGFKSNPFSPEFGNKTFKR